VCVCGAHTQHMVLCRGGMCAAWALPCYRQRELDGAAVRTCEVHHRPGVVVQAFPPIISPPPEEHCRVTVAGFGLSG
jgi:hypothetical protein